MPQDHRYIACVVLKNTLRNHIIALQTTSPDELLMTKLQLIGILNSHPQMQDPQHGRRVKKEVMFIVASALKQEFLA